jgi:hypothetical protein
MNFEPISKGFETKMGLRLEQLKLPTEHLILNLEGVIVNLVYDGAVAQAKPTRSRFHPLEGGLFGAFLIFQNGIFLSVIVNEFKFAYLVRLSVLHNPFPNLATRHCSRQSTFNPELLQVARRKLP